MNITVEERARRTIQRKLGRPVVLNDTGSAASMYDLRIGDAEAPDVAIECVGAVDPIRTEAWNIGPAQGAFRLHLTGNWYVVIKPTSRVSVVRSRLQALLHSCEEHGLSGLVEIDSRLRHLDRELYAAFRSLGIRSIHQMERHGSGEVRLGMTGIGGWVDSKGVSLPAWVGDFLREHPRRDVLSKLHASGARERHAFIPVSIGGVPWPVESYLSSRIDEPPGRSPVLPAPVDAVWITYGSNGLYWDGSSWHLFDATIPA